MTEDNEILYFLLLTRKADRKVYYFHLKSKQQYSMGELERTQSNPLHEGAGVRTIWHRFICVTDA